MRFLLLLFALLTASPAMAQEWRAAPDVAALAAEAPPEAPAGWVHLEGLNVHGYAAPEDRNTLTRLVRYTDEAVPRISARLALPAGAKIHLYLADTQDNFHALQPGKAPDWADGTAWPHRGLIYLRSPRIRPGTASPLEQVLDHEIVHILLGRAFGPQPVPRWLQEGMAQWVAGEYNPEVTERLGKGMIAGGLLTLDDLTAGFPRDPVRANLAYAQSADLVAYISGEYGPETLNKITHMMATGTPVRAAFRKATGHDPDDIDAAWRDRLESSHLWLQPLVDTTVWWGAAALLAIFAMFTVRGRNKKRLRRWEREEAIQDALIASAMKATQPRPPPPSPAWSTRDSGWVH